MSGIIIIGEKLNSSSAAARKILVERDGVKLLEFAREQVSCGASFLDINASMLMEDEQEALLWGSRRIAEELGAGIFLDSPSPEILLDMMPRISSNVVLNSITCEEEMLARITPEIARSGAGVVILLKDGRGIPKSAEGRLELAERAVSAAAGAGIPPGSVFIDPVFTPAAISAGGAAVTLQTLAALRERYPDYERIGGLSNISYGLPSRRLLNRTFLAMAVSHGTTALICDPTDRALMETLRAAETLSGLDTDCRNFLQFYRKGHKPH